MHHRLVIIAALLGSTVAGCKCDDDEHPYTPFGVATSSEARLSGEVDGSRAPVPGPAPFETREAQRHTPPVQSVRLDDAEVSAPPGQLIEHSLVIDAPPAIIAWTVPGPESKEPGGVFRLDSDGAQRAMEFPAFVPMGVECERTVHLAQTGPNSVSVDVDARCPSGGIPRAPTRSLTVLKLAPIAPLLSLRLAAPPPGEALTVDSDTHDRDGDGHDDVALTFTLQRQGSSAKSSVLLVWLDRTAGAARDDLEPGKSFSDIGSIEVVRAAGKNTSSEVADRIDSARRLFAYVCAESGTYRVTDDTGAALSCGNLDLAFERFRLAELKAASTQQDWGRALAALDRRDWYGPKPSAEEVGELRRELHSVLRPRQTERRHLSLRARSPGSGPRLSPLAFDSSGQLLIQAPMQIARLEGDVIRDVSEEIDPWPLMPFGPDGTQVTGLSYPCDSAVVAVTARRSSGIFSTVLETDWLPPRPGACGGESFFQPELRVVSFHGAELHALIGAREFGKRKGGAAMGSPVSPDGRSRVHTTSEGLLLIVETKAQLWDVGGEPLVECVVSNGATAIACLDASNAPVLVTPRGH